MTGGPAGPPVTLATLIWDWGGAYAISYGEDQWIAARRDGRAVLITETLTGLETDIQDDYRYQPVPRNSDPPITPGQNRGECAIAWNGAPAGAIRAHSRTLPGWSRSGRRR
jgi:hypothetical protein